MSETILCTKCDWHEQMKCCGGDECHRQRSLLWGPGSPIFKPPDKQDEAVFQTGCILLLWHAGESGDRRSSSGLLMLPMRAPSPHLLFPGFQRAVINQAPEVKCYWRHCLCYKLHGKCIISLQQIYFTVMPYSAGDAFCSNCLSAGIIIAALDQRVGEYRTPYGRHGK